MLARCQRPGLLEDGALGAVEQLARPQCRVTVAEAVDAAVRAPAHDVLGHQLPGAVEPCCGEDFGQRLHRLLMEACHAFGLAGDVEGALAHRVLGGNTRRAGAGVAVLRLDAADGEHEAARRVAPVGPQRHDARHVEARDDLACTAQPDVAAQVGTDQCGIDEGQPVAQRHADVVHELEGSCTRAALLAVDHDEVGLEPGLEHRLDDAEELPRMADAQLEANRLAAGERAQPVEELQQSLRAGEGGVAGG